MTAMVSPASFTGGGGGGGGGGGAFTVPLDMLTSLGAAANGNPVAINTAAVTAMPTGGIAPYTYSWAITVPDAQWSILLPNAATTQFRCAGVAPPDSYTAQFQCTVTAANGATAISSPCEATATNYGDPGGFLP